MYTSYWHLKEYPFENLADTRFAYLSDQHREAVARMLYLVRGRKLGGVLTGPFGVGKSMILELIGQSQPAPGQEAWRFVKFDAPPGGAPGFVRRLLVALGQQPCSDPAEALQWMDAMAADDATNRHTVIAIDEAQLIREEAVFNLLHLLTNIRCPSRNGQPAQPMFTLLMAGHSRVLDALAEQPSLRQRLQLIWKLDPLNERQTAEYVQQRIVAAGGANVMFEDDAIGEIHRASGGLPRLINNVCDIALMMGCASAATRISRDIVLQAVQDGIGQPPDTA